jgi:tellurite resistance protein TerC
VFHATLSGWAVTVAAIAALIAFDLWQGRRNPHAIGLREAAAWSLFYIGVALLFGVVFGLLAGWDAGTQYFAGYVVEKSLSMDNLFVFVIIMSTFAVPAEHQSRVLLIGIVGALVLRAVFIALGATLLEAFEFMYLVFGLALAVTGVQLFRHRDVDASVDDNVLVTAARRFLPFSSAYDGGRLATRVTAAGCSRRCCLRWSRLAAPTSCSRWTPSPPCSASPSTPTSCSRPTRSRCSACARCSSSSPACWTASSTSRRGWR